MMNADFIFLNYNENRGGFLLDFKLDPRWIVRLDFLTPINIDVSKIEEGCISRFHVGYINSAVRFGCQDFVERKPCACSLMHDQISQAGVALNDVVVRYCEHRHLVGKASEEVSVFRSDFKVSTSDGMKAITLSLLDAYRVCFASLDDPENHKKFNDEEVVILKSLYQYMDKNRNVYVCGGGKLIGEFDLNPDERAIRIGGNVLQGIN